MEWIISIFSRSWTGVIHSFPLALAIALSGFAPGPAMWVAVLGMVVLAAAPTNAVVTSTFILLFPCLIQAAGGRRIRMGILAAAGMACGLWLSRGAAGVRQLAFTIGLWLILFVGAMAIGHTIWLARLRSRRAHEAEWDEQRRSIARELHDNVAHHLAVITMCAEVARTDATQSATQ